jgi:hypothetical protein
VALKQKATPPGPITELFRRLRLLYRYAGEPSTRELARETVISHSTVHAILTGPRVPKWGNLELVVAALHGDREEFRKLWVAASDAQQKLSGDDVLPDEETPAPTLPAEVDFGDMIRLLLANALSGRQPDMVWLDIEEDVESQRLFYDTLTASIRNAKQAIYRTGHGFRYDAKGEFYEQLLHAEKAALRKNIQIIRIQTGARVAEGWAKGYATLLEDFHPQFRFVVDFENPLFFDIGLIDPQSTDPLAYLVFESTVGTTTRPAFALFMQPPRPLASELGHRFKDRADLLTRLTGVEPADVRGMAHSYLYFAWGVHLAVEKMVSDVPDAIKKGRAVLRGWRRNIAATVAGPARPASIQETGDDNDGFHGVVYELSWWGKTRLDRLELRAYESVEVDVELHGRLQRAFTYVPLPRPEPNKPPQPSSWIHWVRHGAVQNKMFELLDELHSHGVERPPPDEL